MHFRNIYGVLVGVGDLVVERCAYSVSWGVYECVEVRRNYVVGMLVYSCASEQDAVNYIASRAAQRESCKV